MAESLRLDMLGGSHITRGAEPVSGFISTKAEALVSYLVMTKRPQSRSKLAGLLWGEVPESDANRSLRVVLSNLRKLLDPFLLITRLNVQINPEIPYELDVDVFEALAKSGFRDGDMGNLADAVQVYCGDFLEGIYVEGAPGFEEWALVERERLRQLMLQALERLSEHHANDGEYLDAIEYTSRALAIDGLREATHRRMMACLARSGQRSAALAQYKACKRILRQELGVEPSETTRALYERILTSRAASAHNLPAQPTPFVGRVSDVGRVVERLRDPGCRLMTLIGPGGVGKTRLAIEAGRQVVEDQSRSFLHGLCYMELTSVGTVAYLVAGLAEALGVTLSQGSDQLEYLLNYLREREMLLVLDNFEQLIDKSGSLEVLGAILGSAPDVKLLVTSRHRLNMQAEWVYDVGGLALPEGEDQVAVERSEAVQLFVLSAQRVEADFVISQDKSHCIVRICQLVEGLPLGIELAAGWVRALSCRQIVEEIERGIGFLETSMHDVPERHRSLQAAFDHSWKYLSAVERQVLNSLSVFRGGFDLPAAERVAAATLPVLTGFVSKSLVRSRGDDRYDMHEALRQFAQGKLQDDPKEALGVRLRHGRYFASFLQDKEDQAFAGAMQQEALNEIGQEIDNLRAGWNWAVNQRDFKLVDKYIDAIYQYYTIKGRFTEGNDLFSHAVSTLKPLEDPQSADLSQPPDRDDGNLVTWARLRARHASLLSLMPNYEEATEAVENSIAIFRRSDRPRELAFSLYIAGSVAWRQGLFAQAREFGEESLALSREIKDLRLVAYNLNDLGYVAQQQGDYQEARRLCIEGYELCQELDDQAGVAVSLDIWGTIEQWLGDYESAQRLLQESLAIRQTLNDDMGLISSSINLGGIAYALGEYEQAKEHYRSASTLARDRGARTKMAIALNNLGVVELEGENYEAARPLLEKTLEIFRAKGVQRGLDDCLTNLGHIAIAQGDLTGAQKRYEESLSIASKTGSKRGMVEARIGLGRVYATTGDLSQARTQLVEALKQGKSIQAISVVLEGLTVYAKVMLLEDQPERALALLAFINQESSAWKTVAKRANDLFQDEIAGLPVETIDRIETISRTLTLDAILEEIFTP